jgi:hypothetical protein
MPMALAMVRRQRRLAVPANRFLKRRHRWREGQSHEGVSGVMPARPLHYLIKTADPLRELMFPEDADPAAFAWMPRPGVTEAYCP